MNNISFSFAILSVVFTHGRANSHEIDNTFQGFCIMYGF